MVSSALKRRRNKANDRPVDAYLSAARRVLKAVDIAAAGSPSQQPKRIEALEGGRERKEVSKCAQTTP